MIIAIDGSSGSGKGTIAKEIAKSLNLLHIDSGAIYRALTLKLLKENISLNDKTNIIKTCAKADIKLLPNEDVLLDNINVTNDIRSIEVTNNVFKISGLKEVREIVRKIQNEYSKNGNIVMEGRDITTVILPNADYKIYLDATKEERARRRYLSNIEKGIDCTFESVLDNIIKRDESDINREYGKLEIAEDAIYIDTTNLSIKEVVDKILNIIKKKR